MNNSRVLIIISGLITLSATQVYGKVATYPFRDRVQKSALIVEGVVEKQTEISDYDRKDLYTFRMKSLLRVTRVYKGNVAKADTITVFSHMNFICDTSRKLAEGRRYLLMLKSYGSGFADVNYGRGMWEIVTLEPDGQFVVGDSWATTGGQPYKQFRHNLFWAMSETPSWPQKPAISAEQARKIALETLSRANVALKGFEPANHELLKIASDAIGVAYKGDPMWYFRWAKPEAKEQSPSPPGTFLYCYVHAHTGKILFGPNLYSKTPPARNVRLFLKTYPHYRPIYNELEDNLSITQLTQEQFRNLIPRMSDTFLKPKPSYPDKTTFLRVEFPATVHANPVVFVLNAAGHIDFAGIIRTDV